MCAFVFAGVTLSRGACRALRLCGWAGAGHIFLLKNMKPAPGSPTDRLWLALPCSFLGRFMAPRGISYFFLGTHVCPAIYSPSPRVQVLVRGLVWLGVRDSTTSWVLSGNYNKDMYWVAALCAICVCVYLQIRWRYRKLDVAALRLVFLVLGMLPLSLYCHPRFHQIMILFYNIQIMVLVQKSFFLLAFHLLHFHSHP